MTGASGNTWAGKAGSVEASASAHFHAARLRADAWNDLKTGTANLNEGMTDAAERREAVARIEHLLDTLEPIEAFWAFPGPTAMAHLRSLCEAGSFGTAREVAGRISRALTSHSYRRRSIPLLPGENWDDGEEEADRAEAAADRGHQGKPYFQVLVVDDLSAVEVAALRSGLRATRRPEDAFVYDLVVVPSYEDAIMATLLNHVVQAVVVRYGFPFRSRTQADVVRSHLLSAGDVDAARARPEDRGHALGRALHELRPELDLYLVTAAAVEDAASESGNVFRRVFYRQEDYLELHLSILRGVAERHRTPFFSALREYAEQPTGVFHALPISRGKSVLRSHWIRDMVQFYGLNIFLAETSATSGGLDSLLEPRSSIKEAQEQAARAFGAKRTYFVTNGTSTANKIVVHALVRPGDIVLVDRNCHKSHHYTLVLSGAEVVYLDSYPLHPYSFYGAVPLESIRRQLLELKAAGKLDRVRLVLLTNCTFDGIVYHPERVMTECLAIKPDLAFVWDEAWFAFARFSPTYRQRTGMEAARVLRKRFRSAEYRKERDAAEDKSRLPDPDRVRVRVYATQSTHKTLTSLRQGSMIHVHDQDWGHVEHAFREAFMTHTSTSPNYQILASLDIGRRQAHLEGYELVQQQIELALALREKVKANPKLSQWFRFLSPKDLVPAEHRPSGLETYYDPDKGWAPFHEAWSGDEFVLDPTRLTLFIGKTGIDGDTFKVDHLMKKHGIQINKTSRNTVLFMTNIGTTRSSVAHLLDVLSRLAEAFNEEVEDEGPAERTARLARVKSLTVDLPPLPDFSRFHAAFRGDREGVTPGGDVRRAYFLSVREDCCEHLAIGGPLESAMAAGREFVAATFLTPYPPGFPILVPGQVVSEDILAYLRALDTKEIHGYRPELGLRVFTQETLDSVLKGTDQTASAPPEGSRN